MKVSPDVQPCRVEASARSILKRWKTEENLVNGEATSGSARSLTGGRLWDMERILLSTLVDMQVLLELVPNDSPTVGAAMF